MTQVPIWISIQVVVCLVTALLLSARPAGQPARPVGGPPRAQTVEARQAVAAIVTKVQRADFEADRVALGRLHGELLPFVQHDELASRVLYWRGFALARSAMNAFNASTDRKEIEGNLTQCIEDFRRALARDPAFVEAKAGAAGCLVNLSFLYLQIDGGTSERAREPFVESGALLKEALTAAPDNPRTLWIAGASQWYAPPDRGGGQSVALATYQRGLELARQQKGRVTDPLEPAWGEAELLMNLALANLNRTVPDLSSAERYADEALVLVPHWHYVRDILMVQIRKAKAPK